MGCSIQRGQGRILYNTRAQEEVQLRVSIEFETLQLLIFLNFLMKSKM